MKKMWLINLTILSILCCQASAADDGERRIDESSSSRPLAYSFEVLTESGETRLSGNGKVIAISNDKGAYLIVGERKIHFDNLRINAINNDGSFMVGVKDGKACVLECKGIEYCLALLEDTEESQALGLSDNGMKIVGSISVPIAEEVVNTFPGIARKPNMVQQIPVEWKKGEDGKYKWTAIGMEVPSTERYQELGFLKTLKYRVEGVATGINSDGSVVVGTFMPPQYEPLARAVVLDGTTQIILDRSTSHPLLEHHTMASGVSADGSKVYGKHMYDLNLLFFKCFYEACFWGNGKFFSLGFSRGLSWSDLAFSILSPVKFNLQSQVSASSGNGKILVGYTSKTLTSDDASVWTTETGMLSIPHLLSRNGVNLEGSTLTKATGISRDGKIVVGLGTNKDGAAISWVATIPAITPEPPALTWGQWSRSLMREAARKLCSKSSAEEKID